MGIVGPIEPLIHVPTARPCLDSRTEAERHGRLRHSEGLRALIPEAETPIAAMAGVRAGTWVPTGRSGIYLVREESPNSGSVEKVRHCWVGSLDPSARRFVPVVSVARDVVDSTANAIRRGGVDPSGIVALYRDEEHRLEKLIEERQKNSPIVSLRSPDGTVTRVWHLPQDESAYVAGVLEECGGAIVGDVAVYRALVRLRDAPTIASTVRPAVRFYHQRDFGVSFAPTARIYRRPLDLNQTLAELHDRYEVEEYRVGDSSAWQGFVERVRNDGVVHRAVGLAVRGCSTAFLIRSEEECVQLVDHENAPDVASRFDAEWVERGVLRRLLDDRIEVDEIEVDLDAVPTRLGFGSRGFAFIVNPPPKRDIAALAKEGWRLPAGSLVIRPGIPRGLFLCPLRPASATISG
ncbi:MAG: DUF1015 family protein [Planctomycetes bacterium]|nr:DUF1015 family protein [Planctomycetota bacterium]